MKKPEINNLIAKVQGRDLTLQQSADAIRELNRTILYMEELEQLIIQRVSQQRELFEAYEKHRDYDHYMAYKKVIDQEIEEFIAKNCA